MINVEHIETFNWEGAIRGMRNPLNSHDKSDSHMCFGVGGEHCGYMEKCGGNCCYEIGENDLALMRKLCRAGSDHRKFLRQIMVSMDITAPLYWWKEFDTYKVGTVANSCSTMHTIHKRDLVIEDFSHEKLTKSSLFCLAHTIAEINANREVYVNWDKQSKGVRNLFGNERENAWENIIQLLPTSYNQLRTVTLNYEVLLNIYHARKNHKLDEWHTMCDTIADMPYFYDICLSEENSNVE